MQNLQENFFKVNLFDAEKSIELIIQQLFDQKLTSFNFLIYSPKITPSMKSLAPDVYSGAKFQVLMKFDQKNEV